MSHFRQSKNFFLSVVYFGVMGLSAITNAQAQTTLRITTIPEEAATEQIRKFKHSFGWQNCALGSARRGH